MTVQELEVYLKQQVTALLVAHEDNQDYTLIFTKQNNFILLPLNETTEKVIEGIPAIVKFRSIEKGKGYVGKAIMEKPQVIKNVVAIVLRKLREYWLQKGYIKND